MKARSRFIDVILLGILAVLFLYDDLRQIATGTVDGNKSIPFVAFLTLTAFAAILTVIYRHPSKNKISP